MAGKKTGKRLLTWVLVLVMALSLLPLNALAANGPETDSSSGMNFDKRLVDDKPDSDGNYTIQMTAQATGTTTTKVEPMDIVLVLDQYGSMADDFNGKTTYKDEARRQYAMKAAVNSFIGEVAAKYSDDADHRMAIVTFSDEAKTLAGWTAVNSDGADALTSEISNLPKEPEGATNVGAGMQMAKNLMNDAYTGNNTDRQKTVIVFTDGVPTKQRDFDTTVADAAIDAAKSMKNSGVTIYTVGIFNGAKPTQLHGDKWNYEMFEDVVCDGSVGSCWGGSWLSDLFASNDFDSIDVPAGNRFLNYLSSNSKNASEVGITKGTYHPGHTGIAGGTGWRIDKNADWRNQSYYMTASDASSLEKIFEGISSTVPAPVNDKLDEKTVITDTLSDYFTFATGTADGDVKVYAGQRELTNGKGITVDLNPTTKTVTVKGYDFSAHHTTSDNPEELVIEIKVKPSGKGCATAKIPTNEGNATVTLDNKEIDKATPPTVDGYSVEYVIGDGASWPNNGNGPEKLYYPQDADVAVTDSVPTREGHKFTGWTITKPDTDSPEINTDETTGKKTFTMPAADVTLTAQWTANKYTVTYALTDNVKPSNYSEPTDNKEYTKDEEYTVDSTHKEGDKVVENGYTYTFSGWKLNGAGNVLTGNQTMGDGNVVLKGTWTKTANTDTKYTVNHYQQNLNDNDYTLFETESDKTGTTGEQTNATAKNYEGFTAKQFEQQTIAADGSTVVEIRYDRNTYTVTYTDGVNNETIFENEVHQNVKYGAPVPAYNNGTNPSRKNYTFAGWDPAVPDTMPANSLKFTAKWEKNPVGDGTFDFNDVVYGDGKNTPAITKTVKGNVGRNFKETFKVAVEPKSENAIDTMSSARYTGEAKVTYSGLKDIAFLFTANDKLTFRNEGKYIYTVWEIPDGTSRMSYDTTEYTLTIVVALDENTNTYQVESWQFTAGNREYPAALNIVNTYRAYHPSTPSKPTLNTGDHYAYVMGYPDGTVRPNGSITRAEVSAILFRLLSDETRDEYFTTESSFTDVKAGAWYNNSIATLEKAGVIVDTAKGGAFRPNEAITRAELAAMLAQFSDAKPVKGVKFSDVSAEHWAYEAIAIAAKMGWIEGYPDGTFRPDATITRAEMMTLVNRALERVPSDEDHLLSKRVMLTFPDCKSGDWFYIAVQEATNSHTYERAATEKNGDEQWTALRANRDWTLLEK